MLVVLTNFVGEFTKKWSVVYLHALPIILTPNALVKYKLIR